RDRSAAPPGTNGLSPGPRHGGTIGVMTPHPTTLDERECRRRLASLTVGRIVYTVDALPAVQPERTVRPTRSPSASSPNW
ncbi:hypothetical protein ACIQAE_40360, partial [Kitasatospora purpeofusca]